MTDARVIVRGVRKAEGLAPRQPLPRAARQHVGPRPGDPYWQERGWTQRRGTGPFTGAYLAGRERFEGRIDAKARVFLIRRPPAALRAHRHWVCFRYRDDGWYAVHFATLPRDMSSGIMEIERILCEALGTSSPNVRPPIVAQPPQPVVDRPPSHVVVSQPQTRKESHDDTRASGPITWDRNSPNTVQQLVAQAAQAVISRSRTRQEIQDDFRAASHLPWGWIILILIVLSFFCLVV